MTWWPSALSGTVLSAVILYLAWPWLHRKRKPPLPRRKKPLPAAQVIAGARQALAREREARNAIGMPLRHPELLTRALPSGQEDWLDRLCRDLWPHDEYVREIHNTRHEDTP